jgi:K+-sensing histidine kinase KdpD
MFRATAEHAGLHPRVQMSDTALTAGVDRAIWATIVTNLLSNAVKYSRRGSIRISLTATDTQMVLTVSDTGVGIDPAEQPLVFHRFQERPVATHSRGLPTAREVSDAYSTSPRSSSRTRRTTPKSSCHR